jgi:hypothetical protein
VNKGPKSEEVVPLARKLGALAVVGNHELAVLRGRHARQQHGAAAKNSRYEWTDQMSEEDVEYVRSLPYTISLPLHNSVVVHAGLVPGVPLKQQNPNDMVTMRTLQPRLDGSGYVVSDKNERGATVCAPLLLLVAALSAAASSLTTSPLFAAVGTAEFGSCARVLRA